MIAKFQEERLEQNKSPFSQRCKKLLASMGEEKDADYLYSLQLAIWGLKNLPLSGPSAEYRPNLLEQAEVMLNWKPEEAEPYLMPEMQNGDFQSGEDWLPKNSNPKQSAAEVTSTLVSNLQQSHPQLGPPSELQ